MVDVELLYRQQVTDSDLRLLGEAAVFGGPDGARVRTVTVGVSPFLTFATAVHRTAESLDRASSVAECWGPRVRVALFDVASLRTLLADQLRRWFLAGLLAPNTRVASGVTWTRTPTGWRRQRFSELDPAPLAERLRMVGPAEQAGVYRRLGDLALFLLGVFLGHLPSFSGAAGKRLVRLPGVTPGPPGDTGSRAMLEYLGSRWYAAAVAAARAADFPVTAPLAVAGHMGEHFGVARWVLNAVTGRYLFPVREQCFGR
jgi:hypothetical protein